MDKALQLVKTGEFEGVRFDCYQDSGKEFWGTREQIGAMLGYSDLMRAIAHIHERNPERLDKFSTVVKLSTVEGGRNVTRNVTVYNFKGLLEICRYSDMPKADAVMDFLWDIADEIRRTGGYGAKRETKGTEKQVLVFDFEGKWTRVVRLGKELWFVEKDFAAAVGYATSYKHKTLFTRVPEDWKRIIPIYTARGEQDVLCISSQGIFALLERSHKTKALAFQNWLNESVLPVAQNTGAQDKGEKNSLKLQEERLNIQRAKVLQRMIETPAYELTSADKKELVKQIITLTALTEKAD